MALSLSLEDFDIGPAPAPRSETAGPSDDWLAGHAEGLAKGHARALQDQATLGAALVQHLEDMSFGYAEARAVLIGELTPLFSALAEQLLPALEGDVLVAHLADAVITAAALDLSRPLTLRVSAQDVVAVSDRLAEATGLPFMCRSEPSLAPGTAIVTGVRGETCLDVAALTDGLRAILSTLRDLDPQETAHG